MLTRLNYSKILKIAVCLFIATTAIFLSVNFVLAASPDLGLNYPEGTGLSNALDIRIIIAKIIRVVLGFLGVIALALIIYAGWLWMTSGGEEEKIEQAKKILTNAVIGLIIILSAFAIASFILNKLTGGGDLGDKPGGGQTPSYGLSALGNGIIESHYPARDQKEVPRNSSIIITFREPILASTLCSTADTAVTAQCKGEAINKKVARIFKKIEEKEDNCTDKYTPSSGCASLVEAKVYSSANGKIFVFTPNSYLGSSSEYINYTVYLSSGLLRQSGEKAFPSLSEQDYGWSFEVSNKIDLTPPQVKENGVFPAPDNVKDTTVSEDGARAGGKITVNSKPSIYQAASVSATKQGASPEADGKINQDCQQDGDFNVAIAAGPIASLYKITDQGNVNLGQGTFGSSSGLKQVVFSECNLTLTLAQTADNFSVGNLWNLAIAKATTADTITAGDITYVASSTAGTYNFKVWPTDNKKTAQSIASALAGNPDFTVSMANNIVTIRAKIAGAAGNSLVLSSSNSSALAVSAMAGGTDGENKVTVNGKKDQPMNSAIQIVFNEAIMPLTVAGTSDELKDFIRVVNADAAAKAKDAVCAADADCKSFICDGGKCAGDNEYLKGKFAVSNQYSTVDFLSDRECGLNACGEKIYCLPANSHLRVELKAADLIACAADNDCQPNSPFNICDSTRKFCRDSGNKYFPQAAKDKPNIVDGIIDAAFNSLDGNRDGSAYGPASFYNENTPSDAKKGDSYLWSFFVSSLLDLTSPRITETTPAKDNSSVNETAPIKISFDKLMLSSRLTTGSIIIQNGKENILHYLLNLRSAVDQPLGYWATNIGRQSVAGGEIDQTDAYINHSSFSKASSYKAQAGSGLKDIYQNCYLPCAGPACAGTNTATDGEPCCCNGAPGESCP